MPTGRRPPLRRPLQAGDEGLDRQRQAAVAGAQELDQCHLGTAEAAVAAHAGDQPVDLAVAQPFGLLDGARPTGIGFAMGGLDLVAEALRQTLDQVADPGQAIDEAIEKARAVVGSIEPGLAPQGLLARRRLVQHRGHQVVADRLGEE